MSNTDARAAASLFDPSRLRVARQLKRMKRVDLAKVAGLSAAAISQYESGAARPRPATLGQLSLKLGVPVGFFASRGRPLPSLDTGQGFFRSLRRTTQLDRDQALAEAAVIADLVALIETEVVLPALDIPDDLTLSPDAGSAAAETIAGEVRQRWDLEELPIRNMVRLLERKGVVVTRLGLADAVDAFSWPIPERPLVILGSYKGARDRSRFDAAHELGHLVMHYSDPEPGSQKLERQAHRFAAAFLMPAEPFRERFGTGRINWTELLELKHEWQVSLAALLFRARDLELLSASAYESAMKQMSRRGWRQQEPGRLGPPERPRLLWRAAQLLKEAGTGLEELASRVDLPVERIEELLDSRNAERPVVAI